MYFNTMYFNTMYFNTIYLGDFMDYQIIIISQNYYNLPDDIKNITLDECNLIDSNSLVYDDQTYYFDYLIFDDVSLINNIKVEQESDYIITNYYQETSLTNIFAIGTQVHTNRTIDEQLEIIINYIINGE